ncbi:putative fructosyl amino acid oxidase [Xylariales sp. PMI_506]|nr:putative fructosyl amino acid oxidase [Xylariales sp. PMI_506]
MAGKSAAQGDESVLIIGSGVFGLSLAYELKTRRNYANVTVMDRYLPPVVDGSSVDISRIIRAEYADPLYAKLAREAVVEWESNPDYSPFFYQSGYFMVSAKFNSYLADSKHQPEPVKEDAVPDQYKNEFLSTEADRVLKERYPSIQADLNGMTALHNPTAGWADAASSIGALANRCSLAGVSFITGKLGTVESLLQDGNRVIGVRAGGRDVYATTVVLATGAWTGALIDGVDSAMCATGQPVGFVQLTPAEAEELKTHPVVVNMDSGWFCFPPTPDTHILKMARHGYGFTTEVPSSGKSRLVSGPSRHANNASSGYLPDDADEGLREGLRQFFPQLANRPWARRRLCWYTDTPKGDFVVDYHPKMDGLFVATGGSGHGFKFLPIIGKYLADCFENKAPDALRQKWKLTITEQSTQKRGRSMVGDGSRGGPPLRQLSKGEQAKL